MNHQSHIKTIFFATLCTSLLWAMLIPLWHFPDEQAHFAQVQDYAELKTVPSNKDVSWEIVESTRILGTLRDEQGHNLYTPIPGYQLPLSTTRYGYAEEYLKNLDPKTRVTLVKQEAPHYPPLYYMVGAFAYEQVIEQDIFTRVFVTRFISVILMACMSLAGYAVARELFPNHHQLQTAATIMISFHPMLMFVGSGVNNDILMNVICALLIAKSLAILNRPFTKIDIVHVTLLVVCGILTKQLIYLLIPSIAAAFIMSWWRYYRNIRMALLSLSLLVFGAIGYAWVAKFNQGFWLPFWPSFTGSSAHFISSLSVVLMKVYKETFAWYWGVYRWLGLVLPLGMLRVIKVLMMVSMGGGIWYSWKNRRNLLQWKWAPWFWVLGTNILYICALVGWETSMLASHGFGHGIQGRYFFPLITTQMALLLAGWWYAGGKRLQRWFTSGISLLFITLNLFSLWYVLGAYYNRTSVARFAIEISQYKPDFAKWPNIIIPAMCCLISLIALIHTILRPRHETEAKS